MDEFTSAEQALVVVHNVVETIGPDDHHRPTPCRDWDVEALAEHLIDTISRLGAAAGIPIAAPNGDSIDQRVQQVTQPILAGWRRRGLTDDVVFAGEPARTPCAGHPVSRTRRARLGLRRSATSPLPLLGRPRRSRPRSGAADPHYESRATAGFDRPVLVPATAGALDQLIAFTGRDPLQMNHPSEFREDWR